MTFDLDLWPTDVKINRDHLLTKDYLPTKFEVSGGKCSWVISCTRLILQSHYPNRLSADGRRAKFWKIGRRRPLVGRRRYRFWLNFWSADDFFVEAPKLKVSLTDPPIFIGFVIGEASGDGRPMIGRQSADVLKKFTSWYRPKVARSSGVNRPTIARRSVDEVLSKNRRQTEADIGRWSPDCRPIIKCGLCYIFYNAYIHIM